MQGGMQQPVFDSSAGKGKEFGSYMLSVCIRHLREDWYERYAIRPVLLETLDKRKAVI